MLGEGCRPGSAAATATAPDVGHPPQPQYAACATATAVGTPPQSYAACSAGRVRASSTPAGGELAMNDSVADVWGHGHPGL